MSANRRHAVTIAGLDPSGGAGLAADIKTFEQWTVHGLPVCSAITFQTEEKVYGVSWTALHQLLLQLELVLKRYQPHVVKIGIIQSLDVLKEVLALVDQHNPLATVVWDPVWRASSGFVFQPHTHTQELQRILPRIGLITPNADEAKWLTCQDDPEEAAHLLAAYCPVFVKSMYRDTEHGDLLIWNKKAYWLPTTHYLSTSKHGSGCVLSSSVAAALAHGYPLDQACRQAKEYIYRFLQSSDDLLGTHAGSVMTNV